MCVYFILYSLFVNFNTYSTKAFQSKCQPLVGFKLSDYKTWAAGDLWLFEW